MILRELRSGFLFLFLSALPWLSPLASGSAFAGAYINTTENCIGDDSITPAEIQACSTIKTVNHCDDFIRQNPQFVDEERQCDRKTLAFERKFYTPEAAASCFGGIIPIKLIGSLMAAARNNAHIREEFLVAADQDVVLKRLIVAGDPRYAKVTDDELEKMTADSLFQQEQAVHQDFDGAAAIVRAENSVYASPPADPADTASSEHAGGAKNSRAADASSSGQLYPLIGQAIWRTFKDAGALSLATEKDAQLRAQFLAAADQNVALKRSLVAGDPRYARATDAELRSMSADNLLVQEQQLAQNRAHLASIANGENSVYAHAPAEPDVRLPPTAAYLEYERLHRILQKVTQEKYQNLVCLDMEFQWQFGCKTAVSLLGMSMPFAGGALRAISAANIADTAIVTKTLDLIPPDIKTMLSEGTEGASITANIAQHSASVVTKLNAISNPPFSVPDSATAQVDELRVRVSEMRKTLLQRRAALQQKVISFKERFNLSKGYLANGDQLRLWKEIRKCEEYKAYLDATFEYQALVQVLDDFTATPSKG